jgi:hypothetical protein
MLAVPRIGALAQLATWRWNLSFAALVKREADALSSSVQALAVVIFLASATCVFLIFGDRVSAAEDSGTGAMDIYDADSDQPRNVFDLTISRSLFSLAGCRIARNSDSLRADDCSNVEGRLRDELAKASEGHPLETFLRQNKFICKNIAKSRVHCRRDFETFSRPSLPFHPAITE